MGKFLRNWKRVQQFACIYIDGIIICMDCTIYRKQMQKFTQIMCSKHNVDYQLWWSSISMMYTYFKRIFISIFYEAVWRIHSDSFAFSFYYDRYDRIYLTVFSCFHCINHDLKKKTPILNYSKRNFIFRIRNKWKI